jgi:uncharacterized protein YcnI
MTATHEDHQRSQWRSTGVRLAALAAATMGLLVLSVPAALAHVSVTPSTAEPGSTAELAFRVPNEEAHAATTRFTVQIPTDHPIAQLLAKPIQGWKVTVHTIRLTKPLVTDDGTFHTVVSQVTWSGGRIEPGQYQDFALSADPLPEAPTTLVFKALQGYGNGDVVRWIDVPQKGQPEPEHPAPEVTIERTAAGTADSMPGMTDNGATSEASDGSSGEGVARVALGISIVAALLAGGSLLRSRRSA